MFVVVVVVPITCSLIVNYNFVSAFSESVSYLFRGHLGPRLLFLPYLQTDNLSNGKVMTFHISS
jgi:hypothetical protein